MFNKPERLLSLDEVADIFQCTRRHVERLIADDKLASVCIGRLRRIQPSAIEAFLASPKEDGTPKNRERIERYAKLFENESARSIASVPATYRTRLLSILKFLLGVWEEGKAPDRARLQLVTDEALAIGTYVIDTVETDLKLFGESHFPRQFKRALNIAITELNQMHDEVKQNAA